MKSLYSTAFAAESHQFGIGLVNSNNKNTSFMRESSSAAAAAAAATTLRRSYSHHSSSSSTSSSSSSSSASCSPISRSPPVQIYDLDFLELETSSSSSSLTSSSASSADFDHHHHHESSAGLRGGYRNQHHSHVGGGHSSEDDESTNTAKFQRRSLGATIVASTPTPPATATTTRPIIPAAATTKSVTQRSISSSKSSSIKTPSQNSENRMMVMTTSSTSSSSSSRSSTNSSFHASSASTASSAASVAASDESDEAFTFQDFISSIINDNEVEWHKLIVQDLARLLELKFREFKKSVAQLNSNKSGQPPIRNFITNTSISLDVDTDLFTKIAQQVLEMASEEPNGILGARIRLRIMCEGGQCYDMCQCFAYDSNTMATSEITVTIKEDIRSLKRLLQTFNLYSNFSKYVSLHVDSNNFDIIKKRLY